MKKKKKKYMTLWPIFLALVLLPSMAFSWGPATHAYILVKRKRMDPFIGQKMIASAILRSPDFPFLLVKAYAEGFSEYAGISYFEAAGLITSAEREFRKTMILYGQALTQGKPRAIQLISEQMAELAKSYLAVYEIPLPEGVDLTPLIKFAIEQSMEICADDFDGEIAATINYVDPQLNLQGISY